LADVDFSLFKLLKEYYEAEQVQHEELIKFYSTVESVDMRDELLKQRRSMQLPAMKAAPWYKDKTSAMYTSWTKDVWYKEYFNRNEVLIQNMQSASQIRQEKRAVLAAELNSTVDNKPVEYKMDNMSKEAMRAIKRAAHKVLARPSSSRRDAIFAMSGEPDDVSLAADSITVPSPVSVRTKTKQKKHKKDSA
jgi:hypothetical protein